MDIRKLTKEQAIIISGFTGILCGEFYDFHADVEKRLGRGVQTFEFGIKSFITEVKKLYEADFIELATVNKEPAKAQAIPDGFVLVPMVPSERMINAVRQCYEGEAYLPYSLYSEFVNQAIIERMEAQEPAND